MGGSVGKIWLLRGTGMSGFAAEGLGVGKMWLLRGIKMLGLLRSKGCLENGVSQGAGMLGLLRMDRCWLVLC